jgi:hypothetical protein
MRTKTNVAAATAGAVATIVTVNARSK